MTSFHTLVSVMWLCVLKAEWKVEIREQLQKIKSDGACYPQQLEEELIRRRRQELRSLQPLCLSLCLSVCLSVSLSLGLSVLLWVCVFLCVWESLYAAWMPATQRKKIAAKHHQDWNTLQKIWKPVCLFLLNTVCICGCEWIMNKYCQPWQGLPVWIASPVDCLPRNCSQLRLRWSWTMGLLLSFLHVVYVCV